MKWILFLAYFCALFPSFLSLKSPLVLPSLQQDRVVILGDSLTVRAQQNCELTQSLDSVGISDLLIEAENGRVIAGGINNYPSSFDPTIVVVGLGTNDVEYWNTPDKYRLWIRSMLHTIGPNPQIFWVNIWRRNGSEMRQKVKTFNAILEQELTTAGNLIDWASSSIRNPQWMRPDGVHDTRLGCHARVRMITKTLINSRLSRTQ